MKHPTGEQLAKLAPRSREAVLELARNAAYAERYGQGERLTIEADGTVTGLVRARYSRATYLDVFAEAWDEMPDEESFLTLRDALAKRAPTLDDELTLHSITWREVREWRRARLATPHAAA